MWLRENDIVESTDVGAPLPSPMRVLSIDDENVWLIALQVPQRSRYASGPRSIRCADLIAWLRDGKIRVCDQPAPPLWLLTDAQLNVRYGAGRTGKCAILRVRDRAWKIIEPFVCAFTVAEALCNSRLRHWVEATSVEQQCSKTWLYHNVHLYWAGGNEKNALLPSFPNCGAKGKTRFQTRKLGRPNAATLSGEADAEGFVMNCDAIEKIQFGWHSYLFGRSIREAYLETCAVFWRAGFKKDDEGIDQPILLPALERPSERQFAYWGPKGDPSLQASRVLMGEAKWNQTHRALPGTAAQDIVKIGQRGWMDSSPCDVHLCSVASRLVSVGSATCLYIIDARSEMIAGFYVGFEAPSARTALLAAAHAAMPKGAWCKRYGFDNVSSDAIPAIRFDGILTDNGEFRNALAISVHTRAWEGKIEFARSRDGAAKGTIESDHHTRHALLDHRLAGTTHGRRTEPGEKDPATQAALTCYEYVRQFIRLVLYHNTKQRVPHLVSSEMRDELDVNATRIDVYRWLVRHGYSNGAPPAQDLIRARMLPQWSAVITERGLFIERPDRGKKRELIERCRFVSKYLLQSGLMAQARKGPISTSVTLDPNDPSVAWLATEDGLQPLENVHPDFRLLAQATVQDLLSIQDNDNLVKFYSRGARDQVDIEFINARETENDAAKAAKQQALDSYTSLHGQPPSKQKLKAGVRDNRQREVELLSRNDAQSRCAPMDQNQEPSVIEPTDEYPEFARRSQKNTALFDDNLAALRTSRRGRSE